MCCSKRKDAMDQIHLLHCVLMSVLLITVHGNTKINITCPDQKGTVGKSLNLTCNVTHSSIYKYQKFKHNGTELQNKMKPVNSNHTFYYTIATATVNDSGYYTFWIQMSSGWNQTSFTVTIGEIKSPRNQVTVAVVMVLLALTLITVTVVVFAYRKIKKGVQCIANHDVETYFDDENHR
ncbi:hypothetical protein C0J50_1741 [Silurus asotus]|uniref:Immunoglobulin I-set domain-containing protein n=1 Tax=Silurus asotus TaxID=30991 RepID=A0AAD5A0V1_SILAS|nr:hypothetical protein C0J50_1741 [Silurus asotus]